MTINPGCWAEVSLARLRRNFRALQNHAGEQVQVCAVIKANAYGHGLVPCAQALAEEGARWLGVTGTAEGVRLRDAGIESRILLMTGFWPGEEEDVVARRLTPVIWDAGQVERLQAAAARHATQSSVHVKVDTGMARLGASRRCLPGLLEHLRAARHVKLEGVCSHLASAEALDSEHARAQIEQFAEVVRTVGEAGFNPEICHLANSAALACRRESWWNMVRAGIALYGYQLPFAGPMEGTPAPPKVEPVLSWKTRVLALRDVPRGQPVGYNSTFVAPSDARLAVLAAGYADGLNRQLSNQGRVIVGACYAPIVGRVSMDLTIADVTRAGQVKVGDEVVLIGRSGELQIDAAEHARLCNTIAYEVLCDIAARVERRYV